MKKVLLGAAVVTMVLASCNSNNKKSETDTTTKETEQHVVAKQPDNSSAIKQSTDTKAILDAYFDVKKGLQEDDQANASLAGVRLTNALKELKESSQDQEVIAITDRMVDHAEQLDKGSIDDQRSHFEPLSHELLSLVKKVGADRVIYEQFCPMYKQKGGTWISDEVALKNPLFGASMLECGITKEAFTPEA